MAFKFLISKLTSIGYHPEEIEYSLCEILQHKNIKLLNNTDIKILVSMLEEKMQFERALQLNNGANNF